MTDELKCIGHTWSRVKNEFVDVFECKRGHRQTDNSMFCEACRREKEAKLEHHIEEARVGLL